MKRILLMVGTTTFLNEQVYQPQAMNLTFDEVMATCNQTNQACPLYFNNTDQLWYNVTSTVAPVASTLVPLVVNTTLQMPADGLAVTIGNFGWGGLINLGYAVLIIGANKGADWIAYKWDWFGAQAMAAKQALLENILVPSNQIPGQTFSQHNAITELRTAETGFNTMLAPEAALVPGAGGVPTTLQNNAIKDLKTILAPTATVPGQTLSQHNAITDLKSVLTPAGSQFNLQNNMITDINNKVAALKTDIADKASITDLTDLKGEVQYLRFKMEGDKKTSKIGLVEQIKTLEDKVSTQKTQFEDSIKGYQQELEQYKTTNKTLLNAITGLTDKNK